MLSVFLISLDRSKERRARAVEMLSDLGLDVEVWPAIDGENLSQRQVDQVYDPTMNQLYFKRELSRAEIGCYLSHRALWGEISHRQTPAALVLEDDAVVGPALPSLLGALEGFDIENSYLKLDGIHEEQPSVMTVAGHGFAREKVIAPRTTGYVIGRLAAAQLASRGRFFRPVDLDLKHYWEHGVPIYTANPPLVREQSEQSTIEASRCSSKGHAVARMFANLRYQAQFRYALATTELPAARTHVPRQKVRG